MNRLLTPGFFLLIAFLTGFHTVQAQNPVQNLVPGARVSASGSPCAPTETATHAANGTYTGGLSDKWCCWDSGPKWLAVAFEKPQSVGRWIVYHAGAGSENAGWNTRDFQLQVSDDGNSWKTVDSVSGNRENVTDRNIAPSATGRYFRLYITNAGADDTARIYDFQLFDAIPAKSAEVASTKVTAVTEIRPSDETATPADRTSVSPTTPLERESDTTTPLVGEDTPGEPYRSDVALVTITSLSQQDRTLLNLAGARGVIVRESKAEGLRRNDVITAIDGKTISCPSDFRDATEEDSISSVTVDILRVPDAGLIVPEATRLTLQLYHPYFIKPVYCAQSSSGFLKSVIIRSMVFDPGDAKKSPRLFIAATVGKDYYTYHYGVLDLRSFNFREVHTMEIAGGYYEAPIVVGPAGTRMIVLRKDSTDAILVDFAQGVRTVQLPFIMEYSSGSGSDRGIAPTFIGLEYVSIVPKGEKSASIVELSSGRIVARYSRDEELRTILPSLSFSAESRNIGALGPAIIRPMYVSGFLGGGYTYVGLEWPTNLIDDFVFKRTSDYWTKYWTANLGTSKLLQLEGSVGHDGLKTVTLSLNNGPKEVVINNYGSLEPHDIAATVWQDEGKKFTAIGGIGAASMLRVYELVSFSSESISCRKLYAEIERNPNQIGTLDLCGRYLRDCSDGRFSRSVEDIQARLRKMFKTPEYEEALYNETKTKGFSKDYAAYLEAFPTGKYAQLAKVSQRKLSRMDSILERLAALINEAARGVSVSFTGFKEDGTAFISINRTGQSFGVLADILTGNLERTAQRVQGLGEFEDAIRASYLSVPGVKKVNEGGRELTGQAGDRGKAFLNLVRQAQQGSPAESPAPKTAILKAPDGKPASEKSPPTQKPATAAPAKTRWVYGTVKYASGAPAKSVCDLVIWTTDGGIPRVTRSYSQVCTNDRGEFRFYVNEPYAIEIHFKGRKCWSGSVKTTQGGRVEVVIQ